MKICFLISLPRSGSTLLQRLLMGHQDVATCGEPWLALPLAMIDKEEETFATYGHFSSARAVSNLIHNLPGGRRAFLTRSGQFIQGIYEQLNDRNALYFLDKTPRYYKIVEELKIMFPEAKFIYLTREPIAVFGSILNYIEGNMYRLPTWRQDIVEGIPCLSSAIEEGGESSLAVNYESLVRDPEAELRRILSYLGLEFEPEMLDSLASQVLNMGDPFGAKKYQSVSQSSLESWKSAINSKTKQKIARQWLEAVPAERFKAFGTSKEKQLEKLERHKVRYSARDFCNWRMGATYFHNNLNVFRWGIKRHKAKANCTLY